MNKKPNLFVNKIDKEIKNNNRIYYSSKAIKDENELRNDIKKNPNLSQKINSIFSSSNYVYKAQVKIRLKDKEEVKKIVGKNQKYLISMDNELIPIRDILDIELME